MPPEQPPRWRSVAGLTLALVSLASIAAFRPAFAAGESTRDLPYSPPPATAGTTPTDLVLPAPMPPMQPFEALQQFQIDGDSPNRFALDPQSIQVRPPFVMLTVAARSPSGATTVGYHGYDCERRQVRLLALPDAGGRWQPSSPTVRWRAFEGSEGRNRQHHAVFAAVCRLGGRPADSTEDMMRVLREGRRTLDP